MSELKRFHEDMFEWWETDAKEFVEWTPEFEKAWKFWQHAMTRYNIVMKWANSDKEQP